jgi:hypothetical protein
MKEIADEECNDYVVITQVDISWEIKGNGDFERYYSCHFHPCPKIYVYPGLRAILKIWITLLLI